MRSLTRRSVLLLVALATIAAACGQSREVAEPVETTVTTLAGSLDETTPTTEAIVVADAAAADEVAVRVTYTDGQTGEILTGSIEDVYEANLASPALLELNQGVPLPPTYATEMANQLLLIEILRHEIDVLGGSIEDAEVDEARTDLLGQLAGFFATEAETDAAAAELDEFLDVLVDTRAHQLAFERLLAEDLDPATAGVPCVRHILVTTEDEANAILDRLADGEDFAALAIELSTGPSGPAGGELGCADSASYVPEFMVAVDEAELNTPVGPVQTQFGFHVLEVTDYELQAAGVAQDTYFAVIDSIEVEITNPDRYGRWDPSFGEIIPPGQ